MRVLRALVFLFTCRVTSLVNNPSLHCRLRNFEREISSMKIRLALLTCILAAVTWAADVTGKWTAQVPGRNGNTREVTMNFKADGDKLTGTMGGQRGDAEISDGKDQRRRDLVQHR